MNYNLTSSENNPELMIWNSVYNLFHRRVFPDDRKKVKVRIAAPVELFITKFQWHFECQIAERSIGTDSI